jgi:hypothetical protein
MPRKHAGIALTLAALAILGAIGANPRYLEELRIGGGFNSTPDGGADFDRTGAIATNGPITAGNVTAAGNVVAAGDLAVNGGDITTASASLHITPTGDLKLNPATGLTRIERNTEIINYDSAAVFGPEGVANGTMDTPYTGGVANTWTVYGVAVGAQETVDTYPTPSTGSSQKVTVANNTAFSGLYTSCSGKKNRWYRLRFAIKVISGEMSSGFIQNAGYENQYLTTAIGPCAWTYYTVKFKCAISNPTLIVFFNNATNGVWLVDSVSLMEIADGALDVAGDVTSRSLLATGGIETTGPLRTSSVSTFTANDTTPSVSAGNIFRIPSTWTAGNNITAFDNGLPGQRITVIGGSANCAVVDGSSLKLAGNWTANADDTLSLLYDGTSWFEISRSDN